jgi:glycosyltransferase involved in cell wall biosynthesis
MSKIKILVVPNDRGGCGKFRCVDPHVNLQNNFPQEIHVDIDYSPNFEDLDLIKKYDLFFFHRIPLRKQSTAIETIKKIQSHGGKVIIDNDDYWHLDPSHGEYHISVKNNTAKTLLEIFKLANLVTVATPIIGDELKKYQNKIAVLPNAIDPNEIQFKPKTKESDFIRFGWLGGATHLKDIELLREFGSAQDSIGKNVQYVLCGFDTRGVFRMKNPVTGEFTERKMAPMESPWFQYEMIFTDGYKNIRQDSKYIEYLTKFIDDPNIDTSEKKYRRIWTKPITSYGNGYNEFDISLIPLKDSTFNKYKSQLKIIEAGFHKKAIIAQNYGPYQLDLISAIKKGGEFENNGNSLLVDLNKNHKDWVKYAKRLVNNPSLVEDLGEKLFETVSKKFDLNLVSKERLLIYKNLLK